MTHHADPSLIARLPVTGRYTLTIGDTQQKGGPEYAYRLRVGRPQPDFALRVVPSSINAAVGTTVPIAVHAMRKDGYAGDIALALEGAPRGFLLSGAVLPAGQDGVRLTLTVPGEPAGPVSLRLVGRANVGLRVVEHAAVPADERMQAFAYRHLVTAQDLKVTVTGAARRGRDTSRPRFVGDAPLRIPAGGTARVQLHLPAGRPFPGTLHFELNDPPEGIGLPAARPVDEVRGLSEVAVMVVSCDAQKVKAGLRGNLIVNVIGERAPEAGGANVPPGRRRVTLGTLPALPFEVVGP
jgi:hypothetical protein